MRASLTVAGVSLVGVGLAAASATPAFAADVTEPCATKDDHQIAAGDFPDNWFMDCVPQYGLGKAEFLVTTTETLPPDFLPLDDPGVDSHFSGDGAAAAAYFGTPPGLPEGFHEFSQSALDEFLYEVHPVVVVAGVNSVTPAELPAECESGTHTYERAYRVNYEPSTVTFTQTAGGAVWTLDFTMTPPPVFLGLNFTDDVPALFDPNAPQCVSNGAATVIGVDQSSSGWSTATTWALWLSTPINDVTLWPHFDSIVTSLGSFELVRSEIPGPEPGLADTGADVSPIVIGLGVSAFLAGTVLFVVSRLQRRRRDPA